MPYSYLNFDLAIDPIDPIEPQRYRARVLNSPAGQAEAKFVLPFSDLELENFYLRISRPRHGVRRLGSAEMVAAREFGSKLYRVVFQDQLQACLLRSIDQAERQEIGLRLRLRLPPSLMDLPWEYLYDAAQDRFLCHSTSTPIVRYLELARPIKPLPVTPPLKVLVMIASPNDYEALDVEAEWSKIESALAELQQRGLIELTRLPEASLGALQRQLRRKAYHVFHFVGHGGFDAQNQDGVLLLEDENRRSRRVSGNQLGTLFHDHASLRLALLNACEGARTSRSDPFAGVAQQLLRQGIPAVIAMQFEITDKAAIVLATEFYSALTDGYPVDAALAEARKAIFAAGNDIEWGTPVLYLCSLDGYLFDITNFKSASAKAQPDSPAKLDTVIWSVPSEDLETVIPTVPDSRWKSFPRLSWQQRIVATSEFVINNIAVIVALGLILSCSLIWWFVLTRAWSSYQPVLFVIATALLYLIAFGLLVWDANRRSNKRIDFTVLPIGILLRQPATNWNLLLLNYGRYRSQWASLAPLEQLVLLLSSLHTPTRVEQFQNRLIELRVPVMPDRLTQALENLSRQRLLELGNDSYHPVEPALARALQMQEADLGCKRLGDRIRAEYPLYETATQFLTAAGFELQPLSDLAAFLCTPDPSKWNEQFKTSIYAHFFPVQSLGADAVMQLCRAGAGILPQSTTIFAIVEQAPTDAGWIAIGAKRVEGVQVIPIDDTFMQRARLKQQERQELQSHLRHFLGRQRDLYNVRDPVADRLNFFGREVRAAELLDQLAEGHPLTLFGLRKMGKSSLLLVLRERAPFPVACVDLQAGVELQELYKRILTEWQRALRVKLRDGLWTPPSLSGDPSSSFTSAVRSLLDHLVTRKHLCRLGLFIDEIDIIVPSESTTVNDPKLQNYLAFARTLRGLTQETQQISLLITGVDARLNRINRWGDEQNPFYQFFREEYLAPLDQSDCIQMVRNIGRQMSLVYTDDAAQFVAEVSGGHPFLARQLCSLTLRARPERSDSAITRSELEAASDRFIREPGTATILDENGMWGEVTNSKLWPPPQVIENAGILTVLAQQEPQSEPALLALAQDRQARERSLTELEQRAVLGRLDRLLRIQFGLFRTWVRRYKTNDVA